MPRHYTRRPVAERFWKQVQKTDSCWIWTGSKIPSGHGYFLLNYKQIPAHRFSWELRHGPIPDGQEVCHDCPNGDNPSCVNPDHLFLGTHADNMRDMQLKGRSAFGERHGQSKLKEADVVAIRRLHSEGKTHAELATAFGVAQGTINHALKRNTWRHVAPRDGENIGQKNLLRGTANTNAKLTDELVRQIRSDYSAKKGSLSSLAVLYGVSKKTVLNIVHNRIWRHVV